MTVTLVTFTPKGARKEFSLSGKPMIIGRKPEADIRIPLDEISRAHAEIAMNGTKVLIKDLGSRNGTYVNEQKIAQATLKAGDQIRAGSVIFIIQIDGQPKDIKPLTPKASGAKPTDHMTSTKTSVTPPPSKVAEPSDDDFDIDSLEELGSPDLSDFDIEEIGGGDDDSEVIEEIDEVEEITELDEGDLIEEDDTPPPKKK